VGLGILALGLLAALLLAGCASTGATKSPTPTKTVAPTATATATPVPTVAQSTITACFGSNGGQIPQVVRSGDFLFAQIRLGFLAYPSVMLPDNTPTAHPYKLSTYGPAAYQADFPNSPITDPHLANTGGGFVVAVCNLSASQTHTLQAITSTISAFTAYGGQLNEYQGCDPTLTSHHQLIGGGCGGALAGCVCFHATFPNNATAGTTVTLQQTDDSLNAPGDHLGKLPFALAPGKALSLFASMDTPTAPGRYTFTFGMRFDNQTTPVPTPASPVVLLAPVAHQWTGMTCQQATLLAQITATNPESYYICAS
jgi:hypothetical protein